MRWVKWCDFSYSYGTVIPFAIIIQSLFVPSALSIIVTFSLHLKPKKYLPLLGLNNLVTIWEDKMYKLKEKSYFHFIFK